MPAVLSLWQMMLTLATQQLQVSEAGLRLRYRLRWLDRLAGWQVDMRVLQASPLRLVYQAQLVQYDPLLGVALLMPGPRAWVPRVLPTNWQLVDESRPGHKFALVLPNGRPKVQASRWTAMAVPTNALLDSLDERVLQLPLIAALTARGALIAPVARSGWMNRREER